MRRTIASTILLAFVLGTCAAVAQVSAPRIVYQPDPEYSEEARNAGLQGTVGLVLIVGADGRPHDIRVSRSLGLGLDEKAVEAVHLWKFEPARKNGQPIAVQINVEVRFCLSYEGSCAPGEQDVPPLPTRPAPVTAEPSTATRTWAMFPGSPSWPSEQELDSLAQACRSGGHSASSYRLGPDAPQTLRLENAVRDLKGVLVQWHQGRRIIVVPVESEEINAWTINAEDIRWASGQSPKAAPDANFSLICVTKGIIDFFGDAPQELEAVVAHEMGHAVDIPCYLEVRPKTVVPKLVQQACESRADAFALDTFVAQGKNPFAVAGVFGRLEMYQGDTSTGILARIANMAREHPITPDRIRDLRRMLIEVQRTNQLQPLPPIIR